MLQNSHILEKMYNTKYRKQKLFKMARDIFDPARYTSCSVKCTANNTDKIQNNERGRLQKVLNKVTQFDPTSKYVAKGKQLISISNKIYDSKIIPRQFADGITGVVDHFAVQPFLSITERVNAEMAGQTKNQLKIVSDSLRAGKLKFKDVEKIAGQLSTLTKYAQNIFNTDPNNIPSALKQQCLCDDVLNPAKFIADVFFPKYTSWFCVEFEFNDHFGSVKTPLNQKMPLFAFLCLRTSRPSVRFEVEEVMKYGYKVFVQKRSEYEPLDLTFIDDDQHHTHTNFQTLLQTLIPNMNLADKNLTPSPTTSAPQFSDIYAPRLDDIMLFGPKNAAGPVTDETKTSYLTGRAGSMNELFSNRDGHVLKAIHIYQIFRWGKLVSRTSFIDPVIASCKWSDLDNIGETQATIDASFRYGSVIFETLSISEEISNKLRDISIPAEYQDMMFDINNGSMFGKSVQLGPTAERVKRYKLSMGADNNKTIGFLDRLKMSVKNAAKRALDKVKNALLNNSFVKSAVDGFNSMTDALESGVKATARWLGDAVAGDFNFGNGRRYSLSKVGNDVINGINNLFQGATTFPYVQNDPIQATPLPRVTTNQSIPELQFWNNNTTVTDPTKGLL